MSDYGLIVADADLMTFMQQHQLDPDGRGQYFSFGRPVRSVCRLAQADGPEHGRVDPLRHDVQESNRASREQERYRQQAERWQAWWEAHWQERTKDEAYAHVNLPPAEIVVVPPVIVLSSAATVDGKFAGGTLSPPDESGEQFLDLDTGLEPEWPKHIPEEKAAEQERELALWAAQNGVDLMCVVYRSPEGIETFALRAFNMRLWEISLRDAEEIEDLVKGGKLPEGKPAGELLLHHDEKSGNTFLRPMRPFSMPREKGASA